MLKFQCIFQVLGELPEHCAFTLVYGVPIYWLAGLNSAPDRFLLNFLLVWLIVYCSRCMALFVAAVLPTLQTSAFMGNALFTVFYLTAGFVISLENMWLGKNHCHYRVTNRVIQPQRKNLSSFPSKPSSKTHMTFFFQWKSKGDILRDAPFALFHELTMNGE